MSSDSLPPFVHPRDSKKVTTAETRVAILRRHVTLLEGLAKLLVVRAESEPNVLVDRDELARAVQGQVAEIHDEVTWLEMADGLGTVLAPDGDEQAAIERKARGGRS